MPFSLAILTGGRASRFGFDKCSYTIGGSSMVEYIVNEIGFLFDEIFLVGKKEISSVRAFCDIHEGKGPVGGLETALMHAKNEFVFLVACDMPCILKEVVKKVLDYFDDREVVCPFIHGKYQTVHTLYSKEMLSVVREEIEREKPTLTHVVLSAKRRYVLLEDDFREISNFEESFLNVNSHGDINEIRKVCTKRKKTDNVTNEVKKWDS